MTCLPSLTTSSMPTIQMAAEAFIRDPVSLRLAASGDELKTAFLAGNNHASRFTQELAS